MKKRIISFILALALCLSLLPMAVAAGSGSYYLSDNIALSKTESWTPANGMVLCLNGKTIRAKTRAALRWRARAASICSAA